MKPSTLFLSLALCLFVQISAFAQSSESSDCDPMGATSNLVLNDDWQSLQVKFNTPLLQYGETTVDGQPFTTVTLDGYMPSAAVGAPSLPTFSRLIEVPLCKGFEVKVTQAAYDTIQLHGARLRGLCGACRHSPRPSAGAPPVLACALQSRARTTHCLPSCSGDCPLYGGRQGCHIIPLQPIPFPCFRCRQRCHE